MKRSLNQHEDALRNIQAHYGRHMDTLKQHEAEAFRLKSSILKLEAQIAEAKRLNKDGFDEGKFMQRRAKPSPLAAYPYSTDGRS